MSAVHRLGDVVIGHKCEVDNCLSPAMNGQNRCYEHSEDRLIEDLFRGENCRFAGANCTVQATACNEYDVPMCANCLSIHNRIRRGAVRYNGRRMRNDELREAMQRDMMNRSEVRTSPLGNTYRYFGDGPPHFGDGPSPFTPPQEEEFGEEDCTCNNLDHSQFNEECPLNEDPPLPTIGHAIASGGLIGILGIPPMRRDEGEETE